jgi:hypothetical protein
MRRAMGVWRGYRRLVDRAREATRARSLALRVEQDVARHMARLLAYGGVRPLPDRETRRIREYAREVFGSARHYPWLHFYAVYRGRFHEGWVPEDYFQSVAIPFLNGAYHKVCQARTLQRRLLGCASMPDLAHFAGGAWFDPEGERIDRARLREALFDGRDEVCVKTEHTIWGRGVSFETREGFDLGRVEAQGALVVQRVIRQADWFDALSPGAVATLRVATGRPEGAAPRLVGAFVRLGAGGSRVVGAGSLEAPILDAAGTLNPFALDDDWRRLPRHPATGVAFDGATVPEFGRMVAHCLRLHDRLPQFGFIGWDVVLGRDGEVEVMEFNTAHPETRLLEMALGPCFVDFRLERFRGMARKDVWA